MAVMKGRVQRYQEQVYTHSHEPHPARSPTRVTIALVSRWGPGDCYERVNRQVLSFNLVTRGNMTFWQGNKSGTVAPGELFIAHKGKNQRFETGPAGFLHKRSILVEGIGFQALMQATGLTEIDHVTFENPSRVIKLFRICYRLMREKPSGFASEMSLLVYALINECCYSTATKHPPAVRAAIEFMEQNLKSNPSLPAIAAAAGLSVRNCIRLFRKHLHDSPLSFFISLKINVAKAMLIHSALSIKQIGMEVGYEDQFHFSAQFKQRTGQSPRAYRAGCKADESPEANPFPKAQTRPVSEANR